GASRDDALPIGDHRWREVGGDSGFPPWRIRQTRLRPHKGLMRLNRRSRAPSRLLLTGILPSLDTLSAHRHLWATMTGAGDSGTGCPVEASTARRSPTGTFSSPDYWPSRVFSAPRGSSA